MAIRDDFPILKREVNGFPLIYLDNAATTQKPQIVIDAMTQYYSNSNANVHRAVHTLAGEATEGYEDCRRWIKNWFNAQRAILTSGTTEAINLVAHGWGRANLQSGDVIVLTEMEHHSDIVPWQILAEERGIEIRYVPVLDDFTLDMEAYAVSLQDAKLVCVVHTSNVLGVRNSVDDMIFLAHQAGAKILIDAAQEVPHERIDFEHLNADFMAFSAHKMCGPTGVGMLYAKESWLHKLPPYQGGGEMISEVTFEKTTYAGLPHKFEAGTPNICGGIAFGAAIDYMNSVGFEAIAAYEHELLEYATEKLNTIEGMQIYGPKTNKTSVISFNIDGVHAYDLGTIVDKLGIAIRTGQHCAQPIMDFFKVSGTARASFCFYNTKKEIDTFVQGVKKAAMMLR